MNSMSIGYVAFRIAIILAALAFGIIDILTRDSLGWPITIAAVLLLGYQVFRIAMLVRARRAQVAEAASDSEQTS